MSYKLGVIMDPIETIKPHKDSTFAMLLAAQKQNIELFYMTQADVFLQEGMVYGDMKKITVTDQDADYYKIESSLTRPLSELNIILMRKDPPFDVEYIYTTHLLDLVAKTDCLVLNDPQALRDANEKLYTAWFPQCCPATLVTRSHVRLNEFIDKHKDTVLKPLEGMGGFSVFRVQKEDVNRSVILELLTQQEQRYIMAQVYIPEISEGDKRILLIDGEPIPYALARIPKEGELRGNLAAGGKGVGMPLTERDHWICQQVGPTLKKKGLMFVGLDIIGDYLTEINVTSPTCIRELDNLYNLDIAGQFIERILQRLSQKTQ